MNAAAAKPDPNDPFALHDMEGALKALGINSNDHPMLSVRVVVKRRDADGQIHDLPSAVLADYAAKTRALGLRGSNLQSTINNIFSALDLNPLWFTGWHGEVLTMGSVNRWMVEMEMWFNVDRPPSGDGVQFLVRVVWAPNPNPNLPSPTMNALHRSELRKFSPEALAEMCIDITAILAELDCLDMIHEAQAERRAAMMGVEVEEPPAASSPKSASARR
jgi:hypothetical protein